MFDVYALYAAASVLTPLMLLAAYLDLKYLKIPNWLCLAVAATFLVTGLAGLPFETFLWRLGYGVAAFFIGFLVYVVTSGKVGGGDIKLISALIPFINPPDIAHLMLLWAILALIGIVFHRLIYHIYRHSQTGWVAFDQKIYFPVGLLIGLTMVIYLCSQIYLQLALLGLSQ